MNKPRAFVHYKIGNDVEWGGFVFGRFLIPVHVTHAIALIIALALLVYGILGSIFSGGTGWYVLGLLGFLAGYGVLWALVGVVELGKWLAREIRDANKKEIIHGEA